MLRRPCASLVWSGVSGQVVINQVKSWQHFCKEPIYDQFVPRDAESPVKENIYYCFCNPLEFTQAFGFQSSPFFNLLCGRAIHQRESLSMDA